MATAEQYIQYQTLRLAVGIFFGAMWIHYMLVYFMDIQSFKSNLERMQFKIFLIWCWSLLDLCARLYLMKTIAWDIMVYNVLMVLILPFVGYFKLIMDIYLFCLLFDELILIYFSLFRMYQFYKKSIIPLWLHWIGTIITFIRLHITFYAMYYFYLNYYDAERLLSMEFIFVLVLCLTKISFDIIWIQLVIRRHLAYGIKDTNSKSD